MTIISGGGVTGIVSRTVVDTTNLSPDDAHELEVRVTSSGILGLTSAPGEARNPCSLLFEIQVEDQGEVQVLRADQSQLSPAVWSLISWIGSVPGGKQFFGPPG